MGYYGAVIRATEAKIEKLNVKRENTENMEVLKERLEEAKKLYNIKVKKNNKMGWKKSILKEEI